jgi:hypothetical protein
MVTVTRSHQEALETSVSGELAVAVAAANAPAAEARTRAAILRTSNSFAPAAPATSLPPPTCPPNAQGGFGFRPRVEEVRARSVRQRRAAVCARWKEALRRTGRHKRNGGRHCCQPPLRRAKDLPVFVTWFQLPEGFKNPLSILAHQLRRRFPSDSSLRRRSPTGLPDRATRRSHWSLDPSGLPGTEIPGENRPMFRGPSWVDHSCVPLRSPPRKASNRVALEEDRLFRRLFPADPASAPEGVSALPAGGDRTFGRLPLPRAVAGSWRGRDRRPDHPGTMHLSPESRKRKMREKACGKRGYR